MSESSRHLRTLGHAPSYAREEREAAPDPDLPAELPPEYFRALLTPRCQRDGICDDCGMCSH